MRRRPTAHRTRSIANDYTVRLDKRFFQLSKEEIGKSDWSRQSREKYFTVSVRGLRRQALCEARRYQLGAYLQSALKPRLPRSGQTISKTHSVCVAIGIRRKPNPQGRPGYVRVDTVHQGDRDGEKDVYHINLVDADIQWEIVA